MARLSTTRQVQLPMRIWDLPTRLFHIAIIVLIAFSYTTDRLAGSNDAATSAMWMRWHLVSGYSMLALLLFRLAWGIFGSDTARFATFLRSPLAGLRHLSRFGVREPDAQVGHNEAGGWMVLIMLLLITVQVGTGLFANTDGGPEGPLAKYVGKSTSDFLSGIHGLNFNILLGAIALHVLAVLAYAVVKGHNLIRPMITGKKRLPAATRAPRLVSPLAALLVLAVAAAAAWAVATQV